MGTNSYDKEDAARETEASVKDVSAAWHSARDDAVDSGHLTRGGGSGGNTEKFSRADDSGKAATGFWGSIFG